MNSSSFASLGRLRDCLSLVPPFDSNSVTRKPEAYRSLSKDPLYIDLHSLVRELRQQVLSAISASVSMRHYSILSGGFMLTKVSHVPGDHPQSLRDMHENPGTLTRLFKNKSLLFVSPFKAKMDISILFVHDGSVCQSLIMPL